ncbi:MAG: nicotinate-nucleotide adenylyltransferase [Acidimicrobiia bacterium]
MERIGIFGGTFDPPHVGHVVAASEVRYRLGLDRVIFVPAGEPWQKQGAVTASAQDRLDLARAAVEGVAGIEVSAIEVERNGPTYSVDTLEALAAPERALYLILGADAASRLDTWHRADDVRALATIVVVDRGGAAGATPPGPAWRVQRVGIPRLDVSSTEIRHRLATGAPIDGLVPSGVARLIHHRGLYAEDR